MLRSTWAAVRSLALVGAFLSSEAFARVLVSNGQGCNKVGTAVPAEPLEAKPKGDTRSYQSATLSNGIRVTNVFDETAVTSAISVAVNAGSFDDPKELPGLAHFCEHMLFLGTKNFPEPEGFDKFVNANGGMMNAYTAEEATVYYVELTRDGMDEAMDRFGDFFRAPLFDRRFVEKEVHAIDSEHAKNVQDPGWRQQSLISSLANPKSPVSTFHTGNFETLFETPKKNGIDTVDALDKWFKLHYCPSRMNLVTFGSQPLSEQLNLAERYFGNISQGSEQCQELRKSWANPEPWPANSRGKWVTIKGTQPQPKLTLYFAIPDLKEKYLSQPTQYINYVMTYGGENSLMTFLKDSLGLVTSLSLGAETNSAGGNIIVDFGLAKKGRDNPKLVLDVFFQYMSTLRSRSVDLELYNSLAKVLKLNWDWSEQSEPADTVESLSEAMMRLPPQHLLSGDSLIETPDAAFVGKLLQRMTVTNMIAALTDPEADQLFGKQEVLKLPYYGVEHTIVNLDTHFPQATMMWSAWTEAPQAVNKSEAGLRKQLLAADFVGLDSMQVAVPPKAIVGVPKELNTKNMVAVQSKSLYGPRPDQLSNTKPPKEAAFLAKTASDSLGDIKAWFRRGWVTTSPKVQMQAVLRPWKKLDDVESDTKDGLRLKMFSMMLAETMSPKMFDDTVVGAYYDVSVGTSGMSLKFGGFAPFLSQVINKTLLSFNIGVNPSDQARFDRIHRSVKESLMSYSEMPYTYAIADRGIFLTPGEHSKEEALAALSQVTVENVASSARELVLQRPLEMTALVMGNLGQSDATEAITAIRNGVTTKEGDRDGKILYTLPVVNAGKPVELRKQNPRAGDPNDVVVITMLHGVSTVENRVLFGLLSQMLSQLAFTELRTKRQLGYVVNAGSIQISNIQGISAVVQGIAMRADQMEAEVEKVYFEAMPNFLKELSDAEFISYRTSFKQGLLNPPTTYDDEFSYYWSPIANDGTCFGLDKLMLKYLDTVTSKQPLIDLWSSIVAPKNGIRQKLVMKYFAGKVPPRPTKQEAQQLWTNHSVPKEKFDLLNKEFDQTLILDHADSKVRAQLLEGGSYYPRDVICELANDTSVVSK